MEIFGDVLLREGSNISFDNLRRIIENPFIKPRYRITVLNPDETVDYVIPSGDIRESGISFTEEYQSGQRRNITLQLINKNGKYTPSINSIWLITKFMLEVGIEITPNNIIWFPKGVYVMGDINLSHSNSGNTIQIQLKDKYSIFEDKTGTLETAYEVETGSLITDAIKGLLNFTMGNGYIFDYKEPIFDPSFIGQRTQSAIRAEEGDNLGTIIDALATQLSAEYYYNNVGNLCFYPINETVNDDVKPIIWTFTGINRELHNLDLSYKNSDVVNCVKVVGDNIDNGVYAAVVTNENPASPICIQRIGKRMGPKYSEANIWNNDLAYDLARYYLRKASFMSVEFSTNVAFNPVLTVNNLCEVENNFLQLKRDKLLITSINYTSDSNLMSVSFCNTQDLPSTYGGVSI